MYTLELDFPYVSITATQWRTYTAKRNTMRRDGCKRYLGFGYVFFFCAAQPQAPKWREHTIWHLTVVVLQYHSRMNGTTYTYTHVRIHTRTSEANAHIHTKYAWTSWKSMSASWKYSRTLCVNHRHYHFRSVQMELARLFLSALSAIENFNYIVHSLFIHTTRNSF